VSIAFILLAAIMLIAALAFVLPPLLRGGAAADPQVEMRRKLKALEQARVDGVLNETEYASKRAALGEAMLSMIDAKPQRAPSAFYAALALALLLPAGAIALYRHVGEPRALDPAALAAHDAPSSADHGPDMEAAIGKLADKLKQNPQDAEGWTLLGRAYKATQRFAEGRDALKRAHELAADDVDISVEYAEALALASPDHRIQGESRDLLDKALKADPQNQRGLWLSGIADSQAGKYDAAIATWTRLLPLLPPDAEVVASIKKQIAQAQALRDGKPLPADDAEEPPAANAAASATAPSANSDAAKNGGPHITVKVTLDPKLKDRAAPGDTLFVFAKAASGPPMPLAIARLTAAQLPASVTLSDGMGMMPSMTLSQFAQVVIGARISKSGQAIAQSGDLQTLSAPIANTRTEPVELTIDQTVP
jgi:cytochrome c-type biogenesis protein CcmH